MDKNLKFVFSSIKQKKEILFHRKIFVIFKNDSFIACILTLNKQCANSEIAAI